MFLQRWIARSSHDRMLKQAFSHARSPLTDLNATELKRLRDWSRTELHELRNKILESSEKLKNIRRETGNELERLDLEATQHVKHQSHLEDLDHKRATLQQAMWDRQQKERHDLVLMEEEWTALQRRTRELEKRYFTKAIYELEEEALGKRAAKILEAIMVALIVVVLWILWWQTANNCPGVECSSRPFNTTLVWIDTAICAFFMWEFGWKMRMGVKKGIPQKEYFRRRWIDFVSSLPVAAFGWGLVRIGRGARVVRIVQLIRILRVLRALRALAIIFRGFDQIAKTLNLRALNRPLVATIAIFLVGGVLIPKLEPEMLKPAVSAQGELGQGEVRQGEGFWWSFTTVVTGGFADIYNPTEATGRALTVVLVVVGAVLTGAFTAALTSVIMGDESEKLRAMLDERLCALEKKIEPTAGA